MAGQGKVKFYAVRSGRMPGIYGTWAECEAQVVGVAGAKYKSFPTREEAEAFLNGDGEPSKPRKTASGRPKTAAGKTGKDAAGEPLCVPPDTVVAFVDGSFNAKTKEYGYGCVLLTPDGEKKTLSGSGNTPEYVSARNVAGELEATENALKFAYDAGYRNLHVCHDYSGIAAWYEKRWKANAPVAQTYAVMAELYRKRLNVTFEKIAAHTGVEFNEEADRLAKAAVGIGEEDHE